MQDEICLLHVEYKHLPCNKAESQWLEAKSLSGEKTKLERKGERKSKKWETENWYILDRIVDQEKERTNKIYIFRKKNIYEKVKRSLNMYQLGSLDVLSFDLPLEKAYYHQAFKLEGVNVD